MDKNEIKQFFDELAPVWDTNLKRNNEIIDLILDLSGVKKNISVLDVASGTGVLFDDYLKREVGFLTGIDISDKMLRIARDKFTNVELICGDAETYDFGIKYDVVMIYNAFPHFTNSQQLFLNLSKALNSHGRITVAHGMSMEELEECHKGTAARVSLPLPRKEIMAEMMAEFFDVDIMISDENMYMVSGIKRN